LAMTLETTYGNLGIFTLKIKIKILAIENLWRNHLFFEYFFFEFRFFGKVWSNKGKRVGTYYKPLSPTRGTHSNFPWYPSSTHFISRLLKAWESSSIVTAGHSCKDNFLSKYIHEPHGNRESELSF
jgi:hypothetical protein